MKRYLGIQSKDAAWSPERLRVWQLIAVIRKAGAITREEYDRWRCAYPEMEVQRTKEEPDALRKKKSDK